MAPDKEKCREGFATSEKPEKKTDNSIIEIQDGDRGEEHIDEDMGGKTCLQHNQHSC